jgi:uncharacterized protein (TIGR03083 family)
MNRQQLLDRLDAAWAAFHQSFAGLADAELTEPGVSGDWSVKDLIAHVTWWEEEALRHLPLILAGGRPPRYATLYGGIDAFNAMQTAAHRGRPLADVLRQAEETHRRLVAYLQTVPEAQIASESRFRRRLRLDTYGHYPIHTAMIREWRERRAAD